MIITYIGHSCFKIQDKAGTDGVTVVTDPFDKKVGLKVPNFEADIVTVSHGHYDHSNVGALRGNPFVVDKAGEYDIKGVSITGIEAYHDTKEGSERGKNIIYRIDIDDMSIAHLGDLGHELDTKQLERLEGTDVLLIPVGGKYTIDYKKAVEVVKQIEPRIVIPMHYKLKGSTITDIDEVDKFIKEIGLNPTYEEKLKISNKDLPVEDTELVILSI
jgi:L-ascorbate metabolism protein UlaG (beta-lactamase superfamily)